MLSSTAVIVFFIEIAFVGAINNDFYILKLVHIQKNF